MQPNFTNKSHLIKLTELQKRKARRRLIGSVFLLLIALLILLHVTTNIQPIAVKPTSIEIKNTASHVVYNSANASNILANKVIASNNVASAPINSQNASAPIMANASQVIKVIASGVTSLNASAPLSILKPRITNDAVKAKINPEDILNGSDTNTKPVASRYYVQLLGSNDKDKLLKLQTILKDKNITTSIQTVDTPTGKVYRLRIGPLNSQTLANQKLDFIKSLMQAD